MRYQTHAEIYQSLMDGNTITDGRSRVRMIDGNLQSWNEPTSTWEPDSWAFMCKDNWAEYEGNSGQLVKAYLVVRKNTVMGGSASLGSSFFTEKQFLKFLETYDSNTITTARLYTEGPFIEVEE